MRKLGNDSENGGWLKRTKRKALYGFYISALLFLGVHFGYAQGENNREDVLIQLNGSHHFVGETIHYSLFCTSQSTGKISLLSKYMYVELVGEEGVVYRNKHALVKGASSGEFFVPSSFNTGKYYLLAYTRWMKNFDDYAQANLVIINPYRTYENPQAGPEKRNIQFAPLTGKIVIGARNRIALRIEDELGIGREEIAILINSDKEPISAIKTDKNGRGSFEFIPQAGKEYSVVLNTKEGELNFKLPKAEEGAGLFLEHQEGAVKINVNVASQPPFGYLLITRKDSIVYQQPIERKHSAFLIRTEDLPADQLEVQIWNDLGKQLASYPLFNRRPDVQSVEQSFGKRELVSFNENLKEGVYSISVQKTSSIGATHHLIAPHLQSASGFLSSENLDFQSLENAVALNGKSNPKAFNGNLSYLPEFRSELMEGKVTLKNGQPAVNKPIILTLGTASFNLSSDVTDSTGNFLIPYESLQNGTIESFLTVYDFSNEYDIQWEDNFRKKLPALDFSPIWLDSAFAEEIRNRALYSQLENAYYLPSADSSVSTAIPVLKPADFSVKYQLDDYTRFRTMKEHFVEYIAGARVRENQPSPFRLNSPYLELNFNGPSLALLDGLPVSGRAILDFSPYRIKSVALFNSRFVLQKAQFDGIVNFTSIDGNLGGFNTLENTVQFQLFGTLPNRNSSFVLKENDTNIPDQRIQLLWNSPMVVNEGGIQKISFRTSDVMGDFQMNIEGITKEGTPVSIVRKFHVKDEDNEKN